MAIAVLICEGVGIISGLLSQKGMKTWLETISKPSWNPPAYLFGPVWTTLYLLMGIALWLVLKSGKAKESKKSAVFVFAIQLFLNFWWSILFFNFHSPLLAFIDIILMLIAISFTMYRFSHISKLAAWLLLPYLIWVCFASFLNYTIWMMN